MTTRVLVVSDMHVGSTVSLMPDEVITYAPGTEREIRATSSPMQKELFRRWEAMCDDGPYDIVIVNGDSCDGTNRKGRGEGVWTPLIGVQTATAVDLLKMTKGRHFVGTQGSIYHTDINPSSDAAVIEALGGQFDDDIILNIEGIRIHAAHKVGVTSSGWQYRTTPIAKEMMMAVLNAPEFGKFDIILRSHAHYLAYAGFAHSLGIITPCWKGRDEFVKRLSLAFNPHIGYITFDIHQDTYDWTRHVWQLDSKYHTKEVRYQNMEMSILPEDISKLQKPLKKKKQKVRKKGKAAPEV